MLDLLGPYQYKMVGSRFGTTDLPVPTDDLTNIIGLVRKWVDMELFGGGIKSDQRVRPKIAHTDEIRCIAIDRTHRGVEPRKVPATAPRDLVAGRAV